MVTLTYMSKVPLLFIFVTGHDVTIIDENFVEISQTVTKYIRIIEKRYSYPDLDLKVILILLLDDTLFFPNICWKFCRGQLDNSRDILCCIFSTSSFSTWNYEEYIVKTPKETNWSWSIGTAALIDGHRLEIVSRLWDLWSHLFSTPQGKDGRLNDFFKTKITVFLAIITPITKTMEPRHGTKLYQLNLKI